MSSASHPAPADGEGDTEARALAELEADWLLWLIGLFPNAVKARFAPHHSLFWQWLWSIRPQVRPRPFVGAWNRGGAKSTSAELACAALAARGVRRYGLYVCGTQDLADKHVGTEIASLLEAPTFAALYPEHSSRLVSKYGSSKGWRRNRLRTAGGFTLDALGLDVAVRGVKVEHQRPDLIIFDDIDRKDDNPTQVERKIETITRDVLPAADPESCAVIAIQNLIHPNSVFARLVDGRADFLVNRIVSGPVPAVADLAVEQRDGTHVIVAGRPTWEGMDLTACQALIDLEGYSAFMAEAQHYVQPPAGGMFNHIRYRHADAADVPWGIVVRTVVWVDPAVTDKDSSDSQGIQADCIDLNGTIWRLFSWEGRTSPLDAIVRALRKAVELQAEAVGIETDQGRDTWVSVFVQAKDILAAELGEISDPVERDVMLRRLADVAFREAVAGAGHGSKVARAGRMLADYESARRGGFIHVKGTTHVLEEALRRFPKTKPLDLVDASFWSWDDLRNNGGRVVAIAGPDQAAARDELAGSVMTAKF